MCFSCFQFFDHFHGARYSLDVFSGLICNILAPHIKDSILTFNDGIPIRTRAEWPVCTGRSPGAEGGRPPPPPNRSDDKGQELPESGEPSFFTFNYHSHCSFPTSFSTACSTFNDRTGESHPLWPGLSKANLLEEEGAGGAEVC